MRWCPLILNLLILLTLSVEQCRWGHAAVAKDASHLVCILDDDEADAELKPGLPPENALLEFDMPDMPPWHELIQRAHADLVAPLQRAERWTVHTGLRRHRWLCQERC